MTHDLRLPAPTDDELTAKFLQLFHREPTPVELRRFRIADARVQLRLPRQARRRAARLIATI
jgi:hypothetical protein